VPIGKWSPLANLDRSILAIVKERAPARATDSALGPKPQNSRLVWLGTDSKGQKICGLLAIHDEKAPAIVMAHGMLSLTDKHEYGLFDAIASKLYDAGFSTLRFDFYGHGETEGDHVDVSIESYKDDLKSAIDFMCSKNIGDIGILANSFGCHVAVFLNDQRVKAFLLNCPVVLQLSRIFPSKPRACFCRSKFSFSSAFASVGTATGPILTSAPAR